MRDRKPRPQLDSFARQSAVMVARGAVFGFSGALLPFGLFAPTPGLQAIVTLGAVSLWACGYAWLQRHERAVRRVVEGLSPKRD